MAKTDPAVLEDRAARLRELLAREPDDASAWFGLGRALLELDRANEAAQAFRRAVAIDRDYTAAHRDLGRALLAAGAAREAADVLSHAAPLAERTGDLQTGREIDVFLRRARRALGEEREEAPAAKPDANADEAPRRDAAVTAQARQVYKEGFALFTDDRVDEAIEHYERAIALDPALAIAWNGLSVAYRQKHELDPAIEAARQLIELEPDDPLSHTNLSILYMQQGLIPEAEEEKAIAMQLQMKAQRKSQES